MITRRRALQLLAAQAVTGGETERLRQHGTPRPLSPDAVTSGWPSFLGPTHDARSPETHLRRDLPAPIVWELDKGTGYTSPAVDGDQLFFFHRLGDEEVLEHRAAETGELRWSQGSETRYRDRYGYNDGPRSSPVLDADRVFTVGAQGRLQCRRRDDGALVWARDLPADYGVTQDFFGTSSSPLIEDDRLIVNVGAAPDACVVAFALDSGDEIWRAGSWGPSYASPVPARIHGERRVMVFAGGESRPPAGGLLSLDPATGAIDFAFPFRSRTYESVNASCPVVLDDAVFVSASYRTGGACVDITPDFSHRVRWTTPGFALHYNTAIHHDGHLYGFDGRNMGDSSLACVTADGGEVAWRHVPLWTETFEQNGRAQEQRLGTARGSLLAVDGQFLCLGELGHLLWLDLTPDGYTEVSRTWLFGARESWTLPVLSRGLLYVVQNTRDLLTGRPPRLLCYDLRA